jgi:DNA-binding LytR/AlgR family response regulator
MVVQEMNGPRLLQALVVDDEEPARQELSYLLQQDRRVGSVRMADSAAMALEMMTTHAADVVFCDIKMPGMNGVQLARVLARFTDRPQIVFVTAYDDHAVDAFDLDAADYLMKPVRAARLSEAVRRVMSAGTPDVREPQDETIPVELGGVTRFVRRSQVRYVEAQGDYTRLHTGADSHLVRIPLTVLEQRWAAAGFARIHRSTLVALAHIDELRLIDGHCSVRLGKEEFPVSRRHSRELRIRLQTGLD